MVGATVTKFVVEDDHVVQIFIFQLKNKNLDTSRNKIWTRPELKSGRVQIIIFQLINKYLDTSKFNNHKEKIEIWTRPDFLFSIEKWKSGRVHIYYFQLKK